MKKHVEKQKTQRKIAWYKATGVTHFLFNCWKFQPEIKHSITCFFGTNWMERFHLNFTVGPFLSWDYLTGIMAARCKKVQITVIVFWKVFQKFDSKNANFFIPHNSTAIMSVTPFEIFIRIPTNWYAAPTINNGYKYVDRMRFLCCINFIFHFAQNIWLMTYNLWTQLCNESSAYGVICLMLGCIIT